MTKRRTLTRRAAAGALGLGASALLLDGFLGLPHANAEDDECLPPDEAPLLVVCEFASGWDTLLSLDPRNHQEFDDPAQGIETAYDSITDPQTVALLAETGGTGLYKPPGSNVAYGPAMSKKLVDAHKDDLCVVRGVDMGTLTHEVGRRYFLTGKFPRGLAASGSSLETAWAALSERLDDYQIPSLVSGGAETYNEGFSPLASGLSVPGYAEMLQALRPLNSALELDGEVVKAAAKFHQANFDLHQALGATDHLKAHRAAWSTARSLTAGGVWKNFDFKANPAPGSALDRLYDAFGVTKSNPGATLSGTAKGQAALAAQALTSGVSQVVLMRLLSVTDAHFDDDWQTNHPRRQREGFDAVADLITLLKSTEDSNGKSLWDRTTLLCFSDFARTPILNAQGGRDHHLASSCLVAGNGVKGNQAIGATKDSNYDARRTNLATGAPDDAMGEPIRPSDIHATLLEAAGLCHTHLSNQDPKLVTAMLKKG
jgi:uncharacterized protein (DUF1501 family)